MSDRIDRFFSDASAWPAPGNRRQFVMKKSKPTIDALPAMPKSFLGFDFHSIEESWGKLNERLAYGGIVFDGGGRILMRKPTGRDDWTFSKGGVEDDDKGPADTAIRETFEETGVPVEIVGLVPGIYKAHSPTYFFLMRPTSEASVTPDDETKAVQWMSLESAWALVSVTASKKNRKRDQALLELAARTLDDLLAGVIKVPWALEATSTDM